MNPPACTQCGESGRDLWDSVCEPCWESRALPAPLNQEGGESPRMRPAEKGRADGRDEEAP
jgi:hypothetical protein